MIGRLTRPWVCVSVVALWALVVSVGYAVSNVGLLPTSWYSGAILLAVILALTVLNVRKKLLSLPLGEVTRWLQIHIYLGLFSMVVFALHVGVRIPNGMLEVGLAVLYLLVAGTGLIGLAISRLLPPRLSRRGEEVIFERIPAFRKHLHERAEQLVVESVEEGRSTLIADFFGRRLSRFFQRPQHFCAHVIGSNRSRHALLSDFRQLDRYLDTREREIRTELEALIETKDNLDFQFAGQALLKYWLFTHIPLTYCLVVTALLHVILVFAFS